MGLRSLLLPLVVGLLLPLVSVPTATSAEGADTVEAAGADRAAAAGVVRRAPSASDDFPRLPGECYDSAGVITSPCRITSYPGRPTVVLWGDSHAQMYLPAVRRVAQARRVNLVALLFGGCPVSVPYPSTSGYSGCDRHNIDSIGYLRDLTSRRHDVRVLIGGFWSGYRQAWDLVQEEARTGVPSGLSDYREEMARLGVKRSRPMFRAIGRLGVPVDLIGQAATVPLDPRRCAAGREPYQCDLPRRRALLHEADNRRWIRSTLMKPLPGRPRLIDATATYCDRTTCRAHVGAFNTFYDDIHLGAGLTSTMAAYFRPVFRDALAR